MKCRCSSRHNLPLFQHTSSRPRLPVQQLLPSVSPALADAAGETALPGSEAAQYSRSQFGASGALLCGLPSLWKSCVAAALQWVRCETCPINGEKSVFNDQGKVYF